MTSELSFRLFCLQARVGEIRRGFDPVRSELVNQWPEKKNSETTIFPKIFVQFSYRYDLIGF